MGWYERVVFNRILEAALDVPSVHQERKRLLAGASGDILDVGTGTGLNLPNYPVEVRRITTLTRNDKLDARALRRAAARNLTLDHRQGDATCLPFDNGCFDTVVCTFVLCSVPNPLATIREFARVLRPTGQLLFFEHVLAKPGLRQSFQRALNPILRVINCGCEVTRKTASLIAEQFEIQEIESYDFAPLPWSHRSVIHGVAKPQ